MEAHRVPETVPYRPGPRPGRQPAGGRHHSGPRAGQNDQCLRQRRAPGNFASRRGKKKCKKGWKKVSWNQKGDTGPQGNPHGAQGPNLVVKDGTGKVMGRFLGTFPSGPLMIFVEINGGTFSYLPNGFLYPVGSGSPKFKDNACAGSAYLTASDPLTTQLLTGSAGGPSRIVYRRTSPTLGAALAWEFTTTTTENVVAQQMYDLDSAGLCAADGGPFQRIPRETEPGRDPGGRPRPFDRLTGMNRFIAGGTAALLIAGAGLAVAEPASAAKKAACVKKSTSTAPAGQVQEVQEGLEEAHLDQVGAQRDQGPDGVPGPANGFGHLVDANGNVIGQSAGSTNYPILFFTAQIDGGKYLYYPNGWLIPFGPTYFDNASCTGARFTLVSDTQTRPAAILGDPGLRLVARTSQPSLGPSEAFKVDGDVASVLNQPNWSLNSSGACRELQLHGIPDPIDRGARTPGLPGAATGCVTAAAPGPPG